MTPYTPGPWRVDSDGILLGADFPRDIPIGRVNLDKHDGEANASLIAAVPDLLEALKATWEALAGYLNGNGSPVLGQQACVFAEIAIEKAEGDS